MPDIPEIKPPGFVEPLDLSHLKASQKDETVELFKTADDFRRATNEQFDRFSSKITATDLLKRNSYNEDGLRILLNMHNYQRVNAIFDNIFDSEKPALPASQYKQIVLEIFDLYQSENTSKEELKNVLLNLKKNLDQKDSSSFSNFYFYIGNVAQKKSDYEALLAEVPEEHRPDAHLSAILGAALGNNFKFFETYLPALSDKELTRLIELSFVVKETKVSLPTLSFAHEDVNVALKRDLVFQDNLTVDKTSNLFSALRTSTQFKAYQIVAEELKKRPALSQHMPEDIDSKENYQAIIQPITWNKHVWELVSQVALLSLPDRSLVHYLENSEQVDTFGKRFNQASNSQDYQNIVLSYLQKKEPISISDLILTINFVMSIPKRSLNHQVAIEIRNALVEAVNARQDLTNKDKELLRQLPDAVFTQDSITNFYDANEFIRISPLLNSAGTLHQTEFESLLKNMRDNIDRLNALTWEIRGQSNLSPSTQAITNPRLDPSKPGDKRYVARFGKQEPLTPAQRAGEKLRLETKKQLKRYVELKKMRPHLSPDREKAINSAVQRLLNMSMDASQNEEYPEFLLQFTLPDDPTVYRLIEINKVCYFAADTAIYPIEYQEKDILQMRQLSFLLKGDRKEILIGPSIKNSSFVHFDDSRWDDWYIGFEESGRVYDAVIHPALRMYAHTIINENPNERVKVVEVCAGEGRFAESLCKTSSKPLDYVFLEFNQTSLDIAKKRFENEPLSNETTIQFKQQDITQTLPLADEEADLVIGSGALAQKVLPGPQEALQALRQIKRVLKPGGMVLLSGVSFSYITADQFREEGFTVLNTSLPGVITEMYVLRKKES